MYPEVTPIKSQRKTRTYCIKPFEDPNVLSCTLSVAKNVVFEISASFKYNYFTNRTRIPTKQTPNDRCRAGNGFWVLQGSDFQR